MLSHSVKLIRKVAYVNNSQKILNRVEKAKEDRLKKKIF